MSASGGAPKRSSRDDNDHESAMPLEKRGKIRCVGKMDKKPPSIDGCISNWNAGGEDSILDKLLLNKRCITVPDGDLTSFLDDAPGGAFRFMESTQEDTEDLAKYFRLLDECMDFDVMDAVVKVKNVTFQYGGFDRTSAAGIVDSASVNPAHMFSELQSCYNKLDRRRGKMSKWGLDHLVKYIYYAMDFIRLVTKVLLSPTECQERSFQDLFHGFCRLSGMELQDASCEASRSFYILGAQVSGKPGLRAHVPVDDQNWWRRNPVNLSFMPVKQTLSAIVQVKLSPPTECDSVDEETDTALGEVVGALLGELMSIQPFVPVAASKRTHLLGILVLSTKVYFVKLYIPESLMAMYTSPVKHDQNEEIEKGTVHITQAFDFMKRRSRLQALKILHKIGTIIPG